ncbi:hypothetical protein MT325_m780R [Paramecium bursaria chlorella virus MT325]|uniref:Uncharacterized protein m780R n=2 Tax=Paramecium bursaria Chlorella virus A1 TaxID=381899 RepID=A7IVG0_PBCVM|nr:hypothetical protein FR483_n768R [Paramecium bursaria Chlorella virus FR483]ABT14334.1 hypothetical protein MT325_m780R [Paramecium bursaria chlorella virus MT325]ABT16053.1 hypothetical protein FR483_n768R [Paramecium bursaria Chlorella virus FR483]
MCSKISRLSLRACSESNGIFSWKNTSCRPCTPTPTGRRRLLLVSASGTAYAITSMLLSRFFVRTLTCLRRSSKSNASFLT